MKKDNNRHANVNRRKKDMRPQRTTVTKGMMRVGETIYSVEEHQWVVQYQVIT